MLKKIGIFASHIASATGRKIGQILSNKDNDSVNGILGDSIIDDPLKYVVHLPDYDCADVEEINSDRD